LIATYNLPANCEFDYIVEFSLDGQNYLATLGKFRAPFSKGAGTVPIGGKCEGGLRVCSSSPEIQQKIVEEYNAASVRRFLEQTKKRIKEGLCGQMQDMAKDPFGEDGK
jgi:hypothetical protein